MVISSLVSPGKIPSPWFTNLTLETFEKNIIAPLKQTKLIQFTTDTKQSLVSEEYPNVIIPRINTIFYRISMLNF